MEIEDYIQKIIDNGNIEDMGELSDMLEDTMEIIKDYDGECYKKLEMKLYKMAYGEVLSRNMAEDIVANMRPYGMRWDYEEIKRMQEQYGLNNIRTVDLFVVANAGYNDYRDLLGEDTDNYIKFSIDFIQDEDAKEGKVFKYFTMLVN